MIAFSIAAPISWWASQKWLEDYAYTINLNGWYFVGAGLLTLIIAEEIIAQQIDKLSEDVASREIRDDL